MTREIKFRGKRIDNGKWAYGYYVISSGHGLIREGDSGSWIWTVIPETVGQFTGLKDMDDKESYEADIVKDYYGDLYVIRWSNDWGGFCLAKPNGRFADGQIYYSSHNPIYSGLGSHIIVGNIHENPDLLTGTAHE